MCLLVSQSASTSLLALLVSCPMASLSPTAQTGYLDVVSEDRRTGPWAALGYVFPAQPHQGNREHLYQHPNIKYQGKSLIG